MKGDYSAINGDEVMNRTGDELMVMAVQEMDMNIVDLMPVPDNVEELLESKPIHVFILQGKTATGAEFELMFRDQQVEMLGRACSIYVVEQMRHMSKSGGLEGLTEMLLRLLGDDDDDDA